MDLVPIKIEFGEEKSWRELELMEPEDVCRRAGVTFDETAGAYRIRSFGLDFTVSPGERRIEGPGPEGELFLGKLADYFRLGVLWYLTSAKDIPVTGRLVRPVDVRGGQRFSAGTHVLPMDKIAERFATDPEGFLAQGRRHGAEPAEFGDASLRFYPLPRVPVTMILWVEDEEFPARADLFFDSTCDFQLDLSDIVWAVALMTSLVMILEG